MKTKCDDCAFNIGYWCGSLGCNYAPRGVSRGTTTTYGNPTALNKVEMPDVLVIDGVKYIKQAEGER